MLTRPLALPGRCQTFLVSDTGAGYWPLIGPAGSHDLDTELGVAGSPAQLTPKFSFASEISDHTGPAPAHLPAPETGITHS